MKASKTVVNVIAAAALGSMTLVAQAGPWEESVAISNIQAIQHPDLNSTYGGEPVLPVVDFETPLNESISDLLLNPRQGERNGEAPAASANSDRNVAMENIQRIFVPGNQS